MSRNPTLVIHGFLTASVTNLPIHATLRRRGIRTFDVPIPGLNTQDIARSSQVVARTAADVLRKTGATKVDVVGVSMGGLIAVHFVRCSGGHDLVRRTVTLGSPLSGTSIVTSVGALPRIGGVAARQMAPGSNIVSAIACEPHPDADIISIWAEGDTVVSRSSAELPGARLMKAPVGTFPIAHYQLVVDPRNLRFMADQLLGP